MQQQNSCSSHTEFDILLLNIILVVEETASEVNHYVCTSTMCDYWAAKTWEMKNKFCLTLLKVRYFYSLLFEFRPNKQLLKKRKIKMRLFVENTFISLNFGP